MPAMGLTKPAKLFSKAVFEISAQFKIYFEKKQSR
jgi:hypothetical protein